MFAKRISVNSKVLKELARPVANTGHCYVKILAYRLLDVTLKVYDL